MTTEEGGGQSLSMSYFFQMWLSPDSTIIAVLYTRLIVVTMSRLSMMQDDDIRVNQFLKNLDHIVLLDTLMGLEGSVIRFVDIPSQLDQRKGNNL